MHMGYNPIYLVYLLIMLKKKKNDFASNLLSRLLDIPCSLSTNSFTLTLISITEYNNKFTNKTTKSQQMIEPKTDEPIIDYESIKAICGDSKQVMVYGFGHCGWWWMLGKLRDNDSPFQRVFSFKVGTVKSPPPKTLEGHEIIQIPTKPSSYSECKAGITNLVLTNYLRKQNNQPIIPLIFLVDVSDNQFPLSAAEIAGRTDSDKLITHSELRRCYKLCTEFEGTSLEAISKVAQETIKFVKLVKQDQIRIIEPCEPVWEKSDWKAAWAQRQATKQNITNLSWRTAALQLHLLTLTKALIINTI